MLEVFIADQHEIEIPNCLNIVADDPFHSRSVLYIVQFELRMPVNRVGEAGFMPFDDVETISFGQI